MYRKEPSRPAPKPNPGPSPGVPASDQSAATLLTDMRLQVGNIGPTLDDLRELVEPLSTFPAFGHILAAAEVQASLRTLVDHSPLLTADISAEISIAAQRMALHLSEARFLLQRSTPKLGASPDHGRTSELDAEGLLRLTRLVAALVPIAQGISEQVQVNTITKELGIESEPPCPPGPDRMAPSTSTRAGDQRG